MLVYLATNTANGKRYVGKTRLRLARRWRQHVRDAANGAPLLLSRAIRKYGADAFELSILGECQSVQEMNALEIDKIAQLRTYDPRVGYNMTRGGDGCLGQTGAKAPMFGKRHSTATREKMRQSHLGKPHPHERDQRGCKNAMFGRYGEAHPSFGRKRTPEQCARISAGRHAQLHKKSQQS
jgi:group I intron endonuclease